MLSFINCFNLF